MATTPEDEPAPEPESALQPIEVATQVLEQADDPAAVATLFAPNALIESATIDLQGGVEEWIQWQTWAVAIGGQWTDVDCSPSGEEVTCSYRQNSAIEAANGVEPSEHIRTFTIEDGLVTSMTERAPEPPAGENEAWTHFYTWLFDAYQNVDRIVDPTTFTPVLTAESIDLWERYTGEYVEFVEHESTVRSMISGQPGYDADTVAAKFAADAVTTAPSVDGPEDWPAWGEYLDAIGIERTDLTCGDGGVLGDVSCSFVYTDRIIRALGLTSEPSVVEMWITFNDAGEVTRWAEDVTLSPDAYQGAFVDFWTWIETNHPDEFPSMINLDNGYDITLEPGVIALFEQYTQEYIESVQN